MSWREYLPLIVVPLLMIAGLGVGLFAGSLAP